MKLKISSIKDFLTNKESVSSRIANGTFWSLTGVALGKAIVLVASIACARILGDVKFGELGIVRSTLGMLITLGAAGLGTTASKYIADYRAKEDNDGILRIYYLTIYFSLSIAFVVTLLVFLFAGNIAVSNFHEPHLKDDIQIGAILLLFSIITATQNGILAGFERFRPIALNTLYASIVEGVGIVAGAYYGGTEGAVLGYGISFVFWTAINQSSINKTFSAFNIKKSRTKLGYDDYQVIWKFSIPSALNSIMVAPAFWAIKSMLVRFNGFGDLGVYEAADQWKIIILFVPNAIANILMPIFANVNGHNNQDTYKRVQNISIILNGSIALLLVLFIYFTKDVIMSLYGAGFENPKLLFVLCSSTVFVAMAQVMTLSLISKSKAWTSFAFNFIWAVILIATSYYFLKQGYGAISLAWANLISYILHFLFQFVYFYSRRNNIPQ